MGSASPPRLRIAVLECDKPLTNTAARFGGYGGVFEHVLSQSARLVGYPLELLSFTAFDVVEKMEYPPSLDEFDAVLLTGSRHNSFENPEWNVKLVEYMKQVLAQERVRVIGVCYGHQIVGRALGAPLGRNDKGWEASVCTMDLTSKGKELFGKSQLSIMQMHRDVLYEYPEGVEGLGTSPVCNTQGMYARNRLLTTQGHPEFTEDIVREIVNSRAEIGAFDDDMKVDLLSRVAKAHDGVVIGGAFIKFLLEDR